MGLFRRGMGPSRNNQPVPEFASQVRDLVRVTALEQDAAAVRAVHASNAAINRKLEKIMHSLDELLDAVASQQTKIDSITKLLDGLHQQVYDALGKTNLTPSMQMRLDQVFDQIKAQGDELDAAISANTVDATKGAISDGRSFSEIKAEASDSAAGGKMSANSQSTGISGSGQVGTGAAGADLS